MTSHVLQSEWERLRPAVFGVAYRLLGSVADAEDVAQDVWLKASAADLSDVADLRAWLVTVAARTSYNVLNSARVRREDYVGPWLPEPLLTGPDAAQPVLVDESISVAMLLVMEELTPPERVAFVLHDVFSFPFDGIAEVLGNTPAASRKLASRARARIAKVKELPKASRSEVGRVLDAFKAAAQAGDMGALIALLHPDAVYVADGGGRVSAARVLVRGAERVALLTLAVTRRAGPDVMRVIEVNGEPALATYREGTLLWVDTVELAGGRVTALRRVANPEKLGHI
ncbi:RNA polymerase sigma factor SigJ [Nonomuraea sp. bgisy101]|uniref:RNA polymerase sigma factor SigJ n=1 Tax=Nonomuraea sp. bgisy101 TaxID=3413784 RepID=UPI003D732442